MPYVYSEMSGVLTLSKITPVIKALFGPFQLEEGPRPGQATFVASSELGSTTWGDVSSMLIELAEEQGVVLGDISNNSLGYVARLLSKHYRGTQEPADFEYYKLDYINLCKPADVNILFELAKTLDDGHGLSSCATQSSLNTVGPGPFEYGGAATFTGLHIAFGWDSHSVVKLGENINSALSAGNTNSAVFHITRFLNTVLEGINDAPTKHNIREQVRSQLASHDTL